MRAVIVHYHLQGGGVTRIVSHLQQALNQRGVTTVVLTGKAPPGAFPGPYRVVPGLQYEADRPKISAHELAVGMRRAAREALGGQPDLWHVHNHSLGKSLILPGALRELAGQGERLLLQIHDFAEDGRPGNYRAMLSRMAAGNQQELHRLLYPQAAHIHYAVLNQRDYAYLAQAGVDLPQLHLVSNPVALPEDNTGDRVRKPAGETLWVYPTRAIRRKNLGEFFLWAALTPAPSRFATTSAPENPAEKQRYQRWKQFAEEMRLPVVLGDEGFAGGSFVAMLRQASATITTSIAEGFGMAFLEPWLLGIPVCGRDLPEITGGFQQAGIRLPWSYTRLQVPLAWLGRERVMAAAYEGLTRTLRAYGRSGCGGQEEGLLNAWLAPDGTVDFGRLDEPMQEDVIRHVLASPGEAKMLIPSRLPDPSQLGVSLAANRSVLARHFSLEQFGEAVTGVYRQVAASSCSNLEQLNGEVLLDQFLAPEKLSLLRVD